MVPYFPPIYPDELLYSVLARYHRHTCSTSPKQTLEDLYGVRSVIATADLPGHLLALSRHLPPERRLTPERLAVDFTLYPYYTAFQPQPIREAVFQAMLDGPAADIHVRLGIAASIVTAPEQLWFCPACADTMVERFGEMYWRRSHQLPGVLVCPDHRVPLMPGTVVLGHANQHEYVAAGPETCIAGPEPPSWAARSAGLDLLHAVAVRSAALLTEPPAAASFAAMTERCRQDLADRGLTTGRRRVDQAQLLHRFRLLMAPVIPVLPEVCEGLDGSASWLAAMGRKHRKAFHPLQHVLFQLFLERCPSKENRLPFGPGPWPCFNPLAGHQGQPVVTELVTHRHRGRLIGHFSCDCGYVYSQSRSLTEPGELASRPLVLRHGPLFEARLAELVAEGAGIRATARSLGVDTRTVRLHAARLRLAPAWKPPKPSRRPDTLRPLVRRDRWLQAQRDDPGLSRQGLARRLPADFSWLYRHDRDWLELHSPPPRRPRGERMRVDWDDLDARLAAAIAAEAGRIRQEDPPVRITMAELERRIDRAGWLGKRLDRLPETARQLRAACECVEAFQLRRVAWAAAEARRQGIEPKAWRLRRLAGLPEKATPAVESALRACADKPPGSPC